MRRSTVLSLPPWLVFPGHTFTPATLIFCGLSIFQQTGQTGVTTRHVPGVSVFKHFFLRH
jgi:hypothetical protein